MKNSKIITIDVSEYFMNQYSLMWNEAVEEGKVKDKTSKPSVKPNYSAIAKISDKDKQTVQTSLTNMFQLIGELLSETGNIEVDIGPLGKFSSINRSLIYSPMNTQKPSALHGLQTVKGLMDLGKDKYSTGRPGQLEPLNRPPEPEFDYKNGMNGSNGHFGGSFKSKTFGNGSSPTRRFKKPRGDGKIINTLLSAGDNPQAKEQEFSMMASDPSMLMSMSFKKPGKAKSRFPPVIDPFSRTLAAPISSLRHYLSVSHRIGTNYTPSSKGYYIDIDNRTIKYKNIFGKTKPFLSTEKEILEPANENEEYEGIMNPEIAEIERIQARKDSYKRYTQYIDEEIYVDVIAPIRVYWINHILELIPADLHAIDPSRVTSLVDSMLKEMNENYYDAVKKSILDYILKDENEMRRLEIYQVLNCPIDWGDNYYKGIEPEEEWKQNVMMARMLMSENLCICSQATLSLMELWQKYESNLFVEIPGYRKEPMTLQRFKKMQTEKVAQVKSDLSSQWNKEVVEILRKELESMDSEQTKTFFESVGTLMANQVRDLVTKSIDAYVEFFERFKRDIYAQPEEIIKREYDPDTPFEDNFLTLKLIINPHGDKIIFQNELHEVQKDLLNIVILIVNQSQNLPRPENTIARADKMHLWAVPTDDEIVKIALNKIEAIVEENNNVASKVFSIYDKFTFLLNEDARLEKFISEPHSREDFIAEITKYKQCIDSIKEELPFEIRMNMYLIDCNELKNDLITKCEELISKILDAISKLVSHLGLNITKRCQTNTDELGKPINSAADLVAVEDYLEKCKDTEKQQITQDYMEVIKWLMILYENPRHKVSDDEEKVVQEAFTHTKKIDESIEKSEIKLKEKRTDQEEKIVQQKAKFKETLAEIKNDVEDFKERNDGTQRVEYNKDIAEINKRLTMAEEERVDINLQEETIGFEVTEFDQVAELQKKIKPFDELWTLYLEFYEKTNNEWRKNNFYTLDPEEVDKDHKRMFQASNKLKVTFERAKLPNPFEVADTVNKQLTDLKKFIPIIQVVCTQGLKERHWTKILDILGPTCETKESVNYKTVDYLFKSNPHDFKKITDSLEEISDTASKEYKNELMMSSMKDEWKEVNYTCKKWKDSYILEGEAVEEIQTFLDDHIVKTQTMKGSPYAKFFVDEILEWEKKLLTNQDNLDVWLKVQAVWLYLAPVFSSEDIMKQMPVEGRNFKEVDRAWKNLMVRINEEPAALTVMAIEELGDILKGAHAKLEQVQKGLNDYLESKRQLFPRFFFLSNDELLEILSETKEPLKVQPHLKKCFEGIAALEFDEEKKIHGMYSSEKENVPFKNIIDPIAARGCVEQWLSEVEETMIKSVKDVCENSIQDYSKRPREKWILTWQGQAVLSGSMIFWTEETEAAMNKSGVQGLMQYYDTLCSQLNDTVGVVRTPIDKLQRCTLEALIVLDVHNRDVIKTDLIEQNINDPNEFAWLAQLRYYWMDNDVWVKITNATLAYNYEYLGNSPRLVITPLTDRCYRTLCGAIHLNYGGAPEGPAGTGKTETVKDLSKALARQCVVFNCSDGLDYLQMGKFFKGLASCGAWSCFDEFNRIELEVLSVIAQQLQTIQNAVDLKKEKFDFEGSIIPLKFTCNCFITMNPGYAGRAELPDNLKALFRTVAMMVPDYAMIAEIVLYSFGFTEAKPLSGKIVTTYKLCSEQLSSQKHYDYGMRAVKSVLTAAGQLKRKYIDQDEGILLLRAINDVNLAKFLVYDVPLFKGITSDLFPGVELPTPDYGDLFVAIKNGINKRNLQDTDYFLTKVIQLYEVICVRHGLMIVGRPFSGKSTAIKVLAEALTELNSKGLMEEMKTFTSILNPKSVSMGQLYGNFDEISHDWSDGVLAVLYREFANSQQHETRKWLIFDGPVDAIWIENMNTVLDDNKKLCLMSGEIIQMSPNMNLIFEPMDLDVASPATVSRCGMIFVEPELLGWEPIYKSWMNELPEGFNTEELKEFVHKTIDDLMGWMVPPLIEFVRRQAIETTPTSDQNLVMSCLRTFRTLLKIFDEDKTKLELPKKEIEAIIDGCFMFSCIWSLCASINTEFRKACNDCFKKLLTGDLDTGTKPLKKVVFPDTRGTIYDHVFFPSENKWKMWSDLIDKNEQIPAKILPQEVIVTTSDKVKYSYLLEMNIKNMIPTLYVGPTGTGKSIYIQNILQNVLEKDKFTTIEVGFSAQTSAYQVQEIIDGKLDKRRKDHFGPRFGMQCVIHVDDLNMPKKEFYGAQPPIELLRQFLDQGGWYDLKDNKHPFRNIIDTMLVCSMGPPGGGKTFITPRMQRHFNVVAFIEFDEATLTHIFKTILNWHFTNGDFNTDVSRMEDKIVAATMKVYYKIQEDLKPTPAKSHYTFNLRDFSKVIMGICMCDKNKCQTADTTIRLWAHETMRVFGDRLINDSDRMWMLETLKDTVRAPFSASFDTTFRHLDIDGDGKIDKLDEIRGLLFGDLLVPYGITERPYEEILDIEKCIESCEDALSQYNLMTDKPMELVLFRFAVEHLVRISRILKQPASHALLVGVGGSGRQSLSRLASKISDYNVTQIEIKKNYGMVEWRENIKEILRESGGKGDITTFLFTDSQIKEEGFLEDINNILNTGEVPNIFPPDEKSDV